MLPRPITVADKYLAAILAELKVIRLELASVESEDQVGQVSDLREPVPPTPPVKLKAKPIAGVGFTTFPLPEDLPGLDALAEAGITHYHQIPRSIPGLMAIPGIGRVTAGRIRDALIKSGNA